MKEIGQFELEYKQQVVVNLHAAVLFISKYDKAKADLKCDSMFFLQANGHEEEIDSDYYKVAQGIAQGSWNILEHDIELIEGKEVKVINPHERDIARMIIHDVQDIPNEDLFLNI